MLDELAELLEIGAVAEEVQVGRCAGETRCGSRSSSCTCTCASGCPASTTGLGRRFEQVDRLIRVGCSSSDAGGGRGTCGLSAGAGWLPFGSSASGWICAGQGGLSLLGLHALGNTVQEIVDGSVWVEVGSAHGSIYLGSCEAHCFHLRDDYVALLADEKSRGIIEGGRCR